LRRDIGALEAEAFDLVVIGGGIFGAAAALDAAQRGLAVALIERHDFAGATSANSFKMIHGGLRYLQHGDLRRLRQSAAARRLFLRIAPHLVRPLPIAVPTYGHGLRSRWVFRLATGLYDALTLGRNRGIADPARHIPPARFLSRAETLARFPGLEPKGLTGAGLFTDGQMLVPARLVLAFAMSAAALGAVVLNHVEATGLEVAGGRVRAVRALDRASGAPLRIRAMAVLNATGPYAEPWLARALGRGLDPPTPFSRDAWLLVARPLLGGDTALAVPAATSDPDALLSRGARHLFMAPWRGTTLLGVWHKVVTGDPDRFGIEAAEIRAWLAELSRGYPGLGLTPKDVALAHAGLVPFGDNAPGSPNLRYGHRSRLVDHGGAGGPDGLWTLIGVRYTTGPLEAVHAVDCVARKLARPIRPSRLATTPLDDGAIAADLVALIRTDPRLGRPLGASPVIAAQIHRAATAELALGLGDAVFRRTGLGTSGHPGEPALADAATVMAEALGWTEARRQEELAAVRAAFAEARTGRTLLDAGLPARPAPAIDGQRPPASDPP
jgi:glycerol-3-phosphate dehydrogenase